MTTMHKAKKAKKLDLFCWKCHKQETNVGCNQCERSFHIKCVSMSKNIKDFSPKWICKVCSDSRTADDSRQPLNGSQLQPILLESFKRISKSADYYFNSDNCFSDKRVKISPNLIINPINLPEIEEKIENFEYKYFNQMTTDFKWLLHNAIIGQLESELLENAKFLLSKVKTDQKDLEECAQCFTNYYMTDKSKYYSWFAKPCPQMHVLVWAKVRGHPYWPSKVIKQNQFGERSVLVRFFGTHEKAWVKETSCYLLSENSPQELRGKDLKVAKLMKSSLEELSYHIKYLNNEYHNWFRYYPKMTPFSIEQTFGSTSDPNTFYTQNQYKSVDNNKQKRVSTSAVNHSKSSSETCESAPNEVETQAVNPMEISFFSSNRISHKKLDKSKNESQLEIIEYISPPMTANKSAINRVPENKVQNTIARESRSDRHESRDAFLDSNCSDIYSDSETDVCPTELKNMKSKKIKNSSEVNQLKQTIDCLKNKIKADKECYEKKIMKVKAEFESSRQRAIVDERNKQIAINNKCLAEVKKTFESRISQLTAKHDLEIQSLENKWISKVDECKTKLWCAQCRREAQLFCCSHTYYCSTDCQQLHWNLHKEVCFHSSDTTADTAE